jgi:hypothetical protein
MNPSRIISSLIYATAFVFIGLYTNYSVRITQARQMKADVAIAAYNEQQARHEAIKSIYNSDKLTLAVDAANSRARSAEYRLQKVCSKMKGRC